MRIFLTSATGYIGAAVAERLRAHGHSIAALGRSARSVERLRSNHIQPVPGDLARAETWLEEASRSDVIVHTAFEYSANGAENLDLDLRATRTLLRAARLVYTSNAYLPGIDAESLFGTPQLDGRSRRCEVERAVLAGDGSAANAVLRLGMVYGGHGGGTIASLFAAARRSGQLPYPLAAADNRWSLIHLTDLAGLYAQLVETPARGVFHAVDGHPLTVRRTLECAGRVCGARVSVQSDDAVARVQDAHTVDVMKLDVALGSARAHELGWSPRYRSFEDGAAPAYAEWCAQ